MTRKAGGRFVVAFARLRDFTRRKCRTGVETDYSRPIQPSSAIPAGFLDGVASAGPAVVDGEWGDSPLPMGGQVPLALLVLAELQGHTISGSHELRSLCYTLNLLGYGTYRPSL